MSSLIDLGSTRLELSNGYWIDVRNQLTARERKRSNSAALKGQTYTKDGGGATITDTDALADAVLHRVAAYVTAWNVTDDGQPVPITADGCGGLPEWLFDEIVEVLDAHIEVTEQAAKNARSAKSTH